MMRTNDEYKDLIDSYLKGTLSAPETALLENDALQNKGLQNELHLQKAIVGSIQEGRKAELKARLNAIKVASVHGSQIWKYAAAAVLLFGAGLATYQFSSFSDKQEVEVTNIPLVLKEQVEQKETLTLKSPSENAFISTNEAATKREPVIAKENKKAIQHTTEVSNAEEGMPSLPELNTPDATSHEPLNKEIVNPEHGLGKTSHTHSTMAGVEVVKSKRHKFHYRYFDNKLFLYGDFEAQTYEILELNTSHGQQLYLKFESKYYDLEPNRTEISKLELVKDKETLKELEEVQKK